MYDFDDDEIYSRTLSDRDLIILPQIQNDYFSHKKCPISIKIDVEGQGIDDNRNFLIGCIIGLSCRICGVTHEMAHFAEREIKKLKKRPYSAWGFSFGKYWEVLGQSGYEAQTVQSVKRELRVWAYQWNLEKHYGIQTSIEDLVASAKYLDAFSYYHSYEDDAKTKFRSVDDRLKIAAEEVRELADTIFTLEAFNQAWFERIEILSKQRLVKLSELRK